MKRKQRQLSQDETNWKKVSDINDATHAKIEQADIATKKLNRLLYENGITFKIHIASHGKGHHAK